MFSPINRSIYTELDLFSNENRLEPKYKDVSSYEDQHINKICENSPSNSTNLSNSITNAFNNAILIDPKYSNVSSYDENDNEHINNPNIKFSIRVDVNSVNSDGESLTPMFNNSPSNLTELKNSINIKSLSPIVASPIVASPENDVDSLIVTRSMIIDFNPYSENSILLKHLKKRNRAIKDDNIFGHNKTIEHLLIREKLTTPSINYFKNQTMLKLYMRHNACYWMYEVSVCIYNIFD